VFNFSPGRFTLGESPRNPLNWRLVRPQSRFGWYGRIENLFPPAEFESRPVQPVARRCRGQLKCDGARPETIIRLSAKRTSQFKSAGASVQSTTGSRGVRISGSSAGYTMFRGGVKGTGYPSHSPVSPSLPPRASPCVVTFQVESTDVIPAIPVGILELRLQDLLVCST